MAQELRDGPILLPVTFPSRASMNTSSLRVCQL